MRLECKQALETGKFPIVKFSLWKKWNGILEDENRICNE